MYTSCSSYCSVDAYCSKIQSFQDRVPGYNVVQPENEKSDICCLYKKGGSCFVLVPLFLELGSFSFYLIFSGQIMIWLFLGKFGEIPNKLASDLTDFIDISWNLNFKQFRTWDDGFNFYNVCSRKSNAIEWRKLSKTLWSHLGLFLSPKSIITALTKLLCYSVIISLYIGCVIYLE